MNRRPQLCVGAVVVVNDELLMVRRGSAPGLGSWSIPGGRVEFGEIMAEAVVREVTEETGVEVLCGALLDWVERIDVEEHFVIANFIATSLDAAEPTAGSDELEAAWVPLGAVSEIQLVDGLAEFLSQHGVIDTLT